MEQKLMLSFGIITDTHIRPIGVDQSSPYSVNERANGRAAYAVEMLLAHKPEFTVHLGDLVHPLPHLPTYRTACKAAREILLPLGSTVHFVPGNHDIGDKPQAGSPAGPVTMEHETAYTSAIGDQWWSFVSNGIRFIGINSSLVNADTDSESRQKDWLEGEFRRGYSDRIFLFSHYPPFIENPGENEHYDNYAEPGRSWLLECAAEFGVEAIFSGHVHHFFYNRYKEVKLYCLPATSFIRQDYAEMFQIGPTKDFGRDDPNKYMVCMVDVLKYGHRLRFIPTEGREVVSPCTPPRVRHPQATQLTPFLRHSWTRPVELPYQGPMEEFSRKLARNDYPLMRLWQLGINTVRTPLGDMIDVNTRSRMKDWYAAGIRFCLFTTAVPNENTQLILREFRDLIQALEIAHVGQIPVNLASILELGFPVRLGRVCSSANAIAQGSKFAHTVTFGYRLDELDCVREVINMHPCIGATFQVTEHESVLEDCTSITQFALEVDRPIGIVVHLSRENPANFQGDEDWACKRVHEALEFAFQNDSIDVMLDTFTEMDRGYHPRIGLLDRLSNFTAVGQVLLNRQFGTREEDRSK